MTTISKFALILTFFAMGLAACSSTSTEVYMAQLQSRDAGGEDALNNDLLTLEDGCLFAGSGAARTLIVWQPGYSPAEQDGNIVIVDQLGRQVAAVGEILYMGGGFASSVDESELETSIPNTCLTGEIFRMSGFLPQEYRD